MNVLLTASDVTRVELVGGTWWNATLPFLAIVISLTSLGITLWFRFRDDARLRLSASGAYIIGLGGLDTHYLHLEATNVGRTGTTVVRSIGIRLKDGSGLASIRPSPMDSSFPVTLGPGDTAHQFLEMDEVAKLLQANGTYFTRLKIEATSGHGKVSANVPRGVANLLMKP